MHQVKQIQYSDAALELPHQRQSGSFAARVELQAYCYRMLASFDDVALMALPGALAGDDGGNLVLVGSDEPLPVDRLAQRGTSRKQPWAVVGRDDVVAFAGDAQVLTDDDAPVDQLLTPYSPPRT